MLVVWDSGADMPELFLASVGRSYLIKAILAPAPQLPIISAGEVDLPKTADEIRYDPVAFFVGNSLLNQRILDVQRIKKISNRPHIFIEATRKGWKPSNLS